MDLALTREVSPSIHRCELTFLARQPISYRRAVEQHRKYCEVLASLGLEVLSVAADPARPDCCFVEDTAVVLDELAVLTHMGSAARRPESPAIERALAPHRRVVRMGPPATLDGGDVLLVGRRLFVGLTRRTNTEGIESLRAAVGPHGYEVIAIDVKGCLHLKSAVTAIDDETLLADVVSVDPKAFPGLDVIATQEPGAANVLRVRGYLIAHTGFPRTIDLLARHGAAVKEVDVSEFLKAEAGVTCKSLLFRR